MPEIVLPSALNVPLNENAPFDIVPVKSTLSSFTVPDAGQLAVFAEQALATLLQAAAEPAIPTSPD